MEGAPDTMSQIRIPAGSIEYLKAPITADVNLDTQPVTLSIDNKATWLPAQWVGTVGLTRTARTTSAVTWAAGSYVVYAKVTDSPEAPIIKCGTVTVS
jgi:hypothetical protein